MPSWFQFHTGSIKSQPFLLSLPSPSHQFQFHTGSIKSLLTPATCKSSSLWFQFHTGSIKRNLEVVTQRQGLANEFQFHTGSIKRGWSFMNSASASCFNSTLVLLKGSKTAIERQSGRFQFHTGSIKRLLAIFSPASIGNGFNSTLVLLKVEYRCAGCPAVGEFQFHTGSIKSLAPSRAGRIGTVQVSIPHWFY